MPSDTSVVIDIEASIQTSRMPEKRSKRGRFIVNVVANVANFLVGSVLGLWFTPYLIRHLGLSAYGVVPLAMTVTSYLAVITLALNSAVGRYITIAIEQGDQRQASRFFNTSLFGSIFLVLIFLIPAGWLSLNAAYLFRVPIGYERDAQILLACTIFAFFLTEIDSAFDVVTYCRNRFDLRNLSTMAAQVIRVGLVVALFRLATPKIWHIGFGILLAALMSFFLSVRWARSLMPNLTINIKDFSLGVVRQLTSTGGWILINQIGTMLIVSIDLIVVNRFFGPEQSGKYASIMQWSLLLRSFALVISGVFGPTVMSLYAKEDIDGLILYVRRGVKFLGMLIALPVGLLCGFSSPLLSLWLGNEFEYLSPLMALMIFPLALNLGYLPLHHVSMATNRVKLPAIIQIIVGALNLILALSFAGPLHLGMYGVALSGIISLSLRNLLFTPIYTALILRKGMLTFVREIIPLVLMGVGVAIISAGLSHSIRITNWQTLIFAGVLVSIVYFIGIWLGLLNAEERLIVYRLVPISLRMPKHVPEKA